MLTPGQQRLGLFLGQLAEDAHGILTFDFIARVHEAIGQLAAGGENQQAGGVDVGPADGDPLAVFDPRQVVEHGDAVARIVGGDNLALGLV